MKGNNDFRLVVGVTWAISFVLLYLFFFNLLPRNNFKNKLDTLEKNITEEHWNEAKETMRELRGVYEEKKVMIQMNNATEVFTTFDSMVGQLDLSVQHEQEAALEYIGGLKYSMEFVLKPFAGP